jgi:hypothetical protein
MLKYNKIIIITIIIIIIVENKMLQTRDIVGTDITLNISRTK